MINTVPRRSTPHSVLNNIQEPFKATNGNLLSRPPSFTRTAAVMIEHDTVTSSTTQLSSYIPGESESPLVCTHGSFTRRFSGTSADLWRLALDPIHALRPCITDGESGLVLNYEEFTRHAARYFNFTRCCIHSSCTTFGACDEFTVWL
jgi:hypothetical protein